GAGGSQMFAYDIDGDGDSDIVSAIHAHGYGLAWFEQRSGGDGNITFASHRIMGALPDESRYGIAFSQLHGLRLADVDGDGVKDIVTGKRYFAHGGKDPGGRDTPVIYWFRTVRGGGGSVDFVPYLIHDASGVGTDVTTGDANADGRLDIVIGNKKGCFVHLQTEEKVAEPKPVRLAAARTDGAGEGLFEGEALTVLERVGLVRPQDLRSFGAGKWSGSSQLWWTGAKPADMIELSLPVVKAGAYRIGVGMTKAIDYGIVEFALDGKVISKPIDLYNDSVSHTGTVALGSEVALAAGEHRLSVKIVGSNPKAEKSYMFGLDYVLLYKGDEAGLLATDPRRRGAGSKSSKRPGQKKKAGGVKAGNDLDAKPLTPAQQQAKFVVPEGFVVELIASEVSGVPKPTAIAFDDAGRLWATTAVEYPRDKDSGIWEKPGRDRVVVIDAPHLPDPQPVRTFADGMVMPMSVLPFADGAVVAQGPEIFFLRDGDQDGSADGRRVLLKGFGVQDTHTLPHQLVRVPGGRIAFSQGVLNSGTIADASGRRHVFDRTLIATMTPRGTDLQIIGVGMNNIWAWAQNRVGRVFIHEANDFGLSLVPFEEDSSYPSFRKATIHPEAPIHPQTATGLNLGGTGFSGIAICDDRAGSFPAPWHGRYFVANPIHGKINSASGTLGDDDVWDFEKHGDLVTCADPMFRPVCITFGPDGCLYIADWYNRIISHNEVARDHPGRDKERGRIWRVRHTGQPRAKITDFKKMPTAQLPASLNSDSTWEMRAAWHQIGERGDTSLIPSLVAMLGDGRLPADARIHALWSLEELGHFETEQWKSLLADPSADLRREAVRSLSTLGVPQADVAPLLRMLDGEATWGVRYEVLRYFRRAKGNLQPEHLTWLRQWGKAVPAKTSRNGALDGSYQRDFQSFLMMLAETKTQLPVMVGSKWGGVIGTNPAPAEPHAIAERIKAVKAALPHGDREQGRLLTEGLCLTCHAIGGKGVGFAPPLDGSSGRDIDGLLTAIIDPDAAIESVFRNFRIETKDATTFEGFNQSETADSITLLVMGGAKQVVPIGDIKSAGYVEGKSVMLNVTGGMDAGQIASIIAYLKAVE
ncbi:MAG: putative membrane-bound dehydrogenase-like protein, partial [Verrucomicrobiales bacterium]